MTTSPLRRSLAAAAIATSLLLSACGGSEPEETMAPTPSEAMTSAPVESEIPEETMEASPSETTPSETTPAMERPATPETGPLEGEALNEAGVAWFTSYCSGITAVLADAQPDTQGMGKDETIAKVVETYGVLGGNFTSYAETLDALDAEMNFENSEAFADFVVDIMGQVGDRYTMGGAEVDEATFNTPDDLTTKIEGIEADVAGLGGDAFGLEALDETVIVGIGQIPECAAMAS